MTAIYTTVSSYSYIQTFYADPDIVNGATQISISSLDLYFKTKPDPNQNASGKASPGVLIGICDVLNDSPILTQCYYNSFTRLDYSAISSYSDASGATTFGLTVPLTVATGQFYGVVIIFEDPGYSLWSNVQGDALVGTNNASGGSNLVKDGNLYQYNNSGTFTALSSTDLKFNLKIAQFQANTVSSTYINDNYEFLTINAISGAFLGGEYVWKKTANAAGTITVSSGSPIVSGSGTTFTNWSVGQPVVIYANSSYQQVLNILSIANTTYMTLDGNVPFGGTTLNWAPVVAAKMYYRDAASGTLILTGSTADSNTYFVPGDTVMGTDSQANAVIKSIDNFSIDLLRLKGDVSVPSAGSVNTSLTLSTYDGSTYSYNSNTTIQPTVNDANSTFVSSYDAFMLSRSNEVLNNSMYTQNSTQAGAAPIAYRKSVTISVTANVTGSSNTLFISPQVSNAQFGLYAMRYSVNANTMKTDANSIWYDTEVAGSGTAQSRHISTKLTFANNQYAEDVRLYMTAYRPQNTYIQVYARLYNSSDSDAFDDKAWTPMVYVENANSYSSSTDRTDFIEYTLGLPQYPDSAITLPGSFTGTNGSAVVTAQGVNPQNYLANTDVVKMYNPLIPQDYIIAVATNVATNSITFGTAIANTNLAGYGFKIDRLKYKNVAFNNITNDNVSRYYSSSLVAYDTYDAVQYKFVLLSDNSYLVPRVDYFQAIGVSA